jgi:hypothetical protein
LNSSLSFFPLSFVSDLSESHTSEFTRESCIVPVLLGCLEDVLDRGLVVVPDSASFTFIEFARSSLNCVLIREFYIHQTTLYITFLKDTINSVLSGKLTTFLLFIWFQIQELGCFFCTRLRPSSNFSALVVLFNSRIKLDSSRDHKVSISKAQTSVLHWLP